MLVPPSYVSPTLLCQSHLLMLASPSNVCPILLSQSHPLMLVPPSYVRQTDSQDRQTDSQDRQTGETFHHQFWLILSCCKLEPDCLTLKKFLLTLLLFNKLQELDIIIGLYHSSIKIFFNASAIDFLILLFNAIQSNTNNHNLKVINCVIVLRNHFFTFTCKLQIKLLFLCSCIPVLSYVLKIKVFLLARRPRWHFSACFRFLAWSIECFGKCRGPYDG